MMGRRYGQKQRPGDDRSQGQAQSQNRGPRLIVGLPIALVLGVLAVGAFAPFGQFWLMPLVLAGLFVLTSAARARRAFALAFAFGLGQFGAGCYWILIGLSGLGGAPLPLAVALLVGLVILLSLFPAIALAIAARIAPASSARRLLLWAPLVWTAIEWLRSWIFSGFPWFSLGYSQIVSPLAGFAPLAGVFAVSWAVALTAGLVAWGVVGTPARRYRIVWAVIGVALIWGIGFGARHIPWTTPAGPPLRVALVQGDIDQQVKWSEDAVETAIDRYAGLTRGHWHAELVVWPETAIPDFYRDVAGPLTRLGSDLSAHGTTLITGLLRTDPTSGDMYNSAAAVGAGNGFYYKRHLLPFGEYFPVPAFVRRWMAQLGMDYSSFTPGPINQKPIEARGVSLGISICYEDLFGALIARDVPPAQILVNISDDAWFGRSIGPAQHFEIARMRAVETGRFLLRDDNSAVTGIVAPDGRVVARAPSFTPTVLTGSARPYKGLTPFDRWGDWIICIAMLVVGVFSAAISWRARRTRRV